MGCSSSRGATAVVPPRGGGDGAPTVPGAARTDGSGGGQTTAWLLSSTLAALSETAGSEVRGAAEARFAAWAAGSGAWAAFLAREGADRVLAVTGSTIRAHGTSAAVAGELLALWAAAAHNTNTNNAASDAWLQAVLNSKDAVRTAITCFAQGELPVEARVRCADLLLALLHRSASLSAPSYAHGGVPAALVRTGGVWRAIAATTDALMEADTVRAAAANLSCALLRAESAAEAGATGAAAATAGATTARAFAAGFVDSGTLTHVLQLLMASACSMPRAPAAAATSTTATLLAAVGLLLLSAASRCGMAATQMLAHAAPAAAVTTALHACLNVGLPPRAAAGTEGAVEDEEEEDAAAAVEHAAVVCLPAWAHDLAIVFARIIGALVAIPGDAGGRIALEQFAREGAPFALLRLLNATGEGSPQEAGARTTAAQAVAMQVLAAFVAESRAVTAASAAAAAAAAEPAPPVHIDGGDGGSTVGPSTPARAMHAPNPMHAASASRLSPASAPTTPTRLTAHVYRPDAAVGVEDWSEVFMSGGGGDEGGDERGGGGGGAAPRSAIGAALAVSGFLDHPLFDGIARPVHGTSLAAPAQRGGARGSLRLNPPLRGTGAPSSGGGIRPAAPPAAPPHAGGSPVARGGGSPVARVGSNEPASRHGSGGGSAGGGGGGMFGAHARGRTHGAPPDAAAASLARLALWTAPPLAAAAAVSAAATGLALLDGVVANPDALTSALARGTTLEGRLLDIFVLRPPPPPSTAATPSTSATDPFAAVCTFAARRAGVLVWLAAGARQAVAAERAARATATLARLRDGQLADAATRLLALCAAKDLTLPELASHADMVAALLVRERREGRLWVQRRRAAAHTATRGGGAGGGGSDGPLASLRAMLGARTPTPSSRVRVNADGSSPAEEVAAAVAVAAAMPRSTLGVITGIYPVEVDVGEGGGGGATAATGGDNDALWAYGECLRRGLLVAPPTGTKPADAVTLFVLAAIAADALVAATAGGELLLPEGDDRRAAGVAFLHGAVDALRAAHTPATPLPLLWNDTMTGRLVAWAHSACDEVVALACVAAVGARGAAEAWWEGEVAAPAPAPAPLVPVPPARAHAKLAPQQSHRALLPPEAGTTAAAIARRHAWLAGVPHSSLAASDAAAVSAAAMPTSGGGGGGFGTPWQTAAAAGTALPPLQLRAYLHAAGCAVLFRDAHAAHLAGRANRPWLQMALGDAIVALGTAPGLAAALAEEGGSDAEEAATAGAAAATAVGGTATALPSAPTGTSVAVASSNPLMAALSVAAAVRL